MSIHLHDMKNTLCKKGKLNFMTESAAIRSKVMCTSETHNRKFQVWSILPFLTKTLHEGSQIYSSIIQFVVTLTITRSKWPLIALNGNQAFTCESRILSI